MGPVTAAKMEALGIRTGADLAAQPLALLELHFGSSAGYFHRAAQGQDAVQGGLGRPAHQAAFSRVS